jgi:hypothetical protein
MIWCKSKTLLKSGSNVGKSNEMICPRGAVIDGGYFYPRSSPRKDQFDGG